MTPPRSKSGLFKPGSINYIKPQKNRSIKKTIIYFCFSIRRLFSVLAVIVSAYLMFIYAIIQSLF